MALWVFLCVFPAAFSARNLNGEYVVSSGGNFDVPFNTDYASKGYEYFDVWGKEIATHYGEVYWTMQGDVPLPKDIVERFDGKTIAIVGYETDQVMVRPAGQPGINPKLDVSVPFTWAYNHHYEAWLVSKFAKMTQVQAGPLDTRSHGAPVRWTALDTEEAAFLADSDIPTKQFFSEGNGGESRKSFHGYPKGFAQLLQSPTHFALTPMQIDTRNRDCGVTPADINNCTQFIPGPEPKQARYGRKPAKTNNSGLIECPCTSRFGGDPIFYPDEKTKIETHDYEIKFGGSCKRNQKVDNIAECLSAVQAAGFNATTFKNVTTSTPDLPVGCSVVLKGDVAMVTLNKITESKVECGKTGVAMTAQGTSRVGVTVRISLDEDKGSFKMSRKSKGLYCSLNHNDVLESFAMTTESDTDAQDSMRKCEKFCMESDECGACSVDCSLGSIERCQWVAIPDCGNFREWKGRIPGDISVKSPIGNATITMSGPSDVWFGAGFNATAMAYQPYTIIVNDKGVIEQKIGTCGTEADHCPGNQLASTITVLSHSVSGKVRTVTFTREMQGATPNHYTFNPKVQDTIHFITAVGRVQTFSYHRAHGPIVLSFAAESEPLCICDVGKMGHLCHSNATKCEAFDKPCAPPGVGSLQEQRNPTCNSLQYSGGLRCCTHKNILLDADQEVRPELLRYHLKFRFWFQEYTPAPANETKPKPSHHDLPRIYFQTESFAGEYDVPPAFRSKDRPIVGYPDWPLGKPTPGTTCTGNCPDGRDCECVHTITYKTTANNWRLIYAGGHCHAPSCISIELYRNDTGHEMELLCRQLPIYGKGNITHDKFDDAGYVTLPPCLWGDDEGLEPSVFLPKGTPLVSIKKNRNTHTGHYGEMASWQMRGVNF